MRAIEGSQATAIFKKEISALRDLCFRPYWHRLWIIQEVVLARSCIVCCDDEKTYTPTISELFEEIKFRTSPPFADSPALDYETTAALEGICDSIPARLSKSQQVISRQTIRPKAPLSFFEGVPKPLFYFWELFNGSLCEDPRDKVFGLLSLARECCKEEVDYSVDYLQPYMSVLQHYLLRHAKQHYLGHVKDMGISQRFYHSIGVTTMYPPITPSPYTISDERIFETNGRLRGRLSYVSRPLRNIQAPGTQDILEMPILSDLSKHGLVHIENLRAAGESHQPHMTKEVDIITSINQGTSTATFAPPDPYTSSWFEWEDLNLQEQISTNTKSNTMTALHHLLADAHLAVSGTSSDNTRIGIEENGFIGFMPHDAQDGDLVCQFNDSNIIVIVRRTPDTYRGVIIGRAIDFLASPSNVSFPIYRARESGKAFDVPSWTVNLELDFLTLQLLSRASVTPSYI